MKERARYLLHLLPLSWSLVGCSWIFVKPLPPDYQRGDRVDCTTNYAAPVADTLLGLSNIVAAAYVDGASNGKSSSATTAVASGAAIWAGIYIGTAIHGYRAVAACRDVMSDEADDAPLYPHPGLHSRLPAPSVHSPNAGSPGPPIEPEPAMPAPAGSVQQLDDDDPGRPPPPRRPAPIQPKPDAPRFGG